MNTIYGNEENTEKQHMDEKRKEMIVSSENLKEV